MRFYERSEIKDALGLFFRVLVNVYDNSSLERIINTPKKGIGKILLKKLYVISNREKITLINSLELILEDKKIPESTRKNIKILCQ